jgi:hypothetical protein
MKRNACAIVYGKQEISFETVPARRKTMEIAVHPDGKVVVKSPPGLSLDEVRQRVLNRARWISRQIAWFQQFQPRTPPRQYVSGETHLYLGRQYRLKLISGDRNHVRLERGRFVVTCRGEASPEKVRRLLDGWYLEKARMKFAESLDLCFSPFQRMGCKKPSLRIRRMKTRWGSLSHSGAMTLNRELIRAPRECIDYVITHELCHLKHKNHSPAFYRLLEQAMPDWEKRKHRLELAMV